MTLGMLKAFVAVWDRQTDAQRDLMLIVLLEMGWPSQASQDQ